MIANDVFGHEAAALINELNYHSNRHCQTCTGVLLKSAGLDSSNSQFSDLARLIHAATHHNQDLAHGGNGLVCEQRTGSDQVRYRFDPCTCSGPPSR